MNNIERAKSEITSILDASENKEKTKQWIREALEEYSCSTHENNDNIQLHFHNATVGITSSVMELTVTESGPPFSESSSIKVNPNDKDSIMAKVKDIAIQQAIGQGFRQLIEWVIG
jgi:hypothetical protein